MNIKGNKTTTGPMEWNTALGLCYQLRKDGLLRDYLLIVCGIHYGMRISDLLTLRYSDVLGKDEFVVTERKTGKQRKITINATVKDALQYVANELMKKGAFQPDQFLFANRWGQPISVSFVNKRLPKLFVKYKVRCTDNNSSHALRKTFGKRVFNAFGNSEQALVYLSDVFGHSSTAITRVYIGLTAETIKNVYIRL